MSPSPKMWLRLPSRSTEKWSFCSTGPMRSSSRARRADPTNSICPLPAASEDAGCSGGGEGGNDDDNKDDDDDKEEEDDDEDDDDDKEDGNATADEDSDDGDAPIAM